MSEEKEVEHKKPNINMLEILFYVFLVDVFMKMTTPEEREELKKEILKDENRNK
jgi:hypothetical protein